jgi:hypothetical protein
MLHVPKQPRSLFTIDNWGANPSGTSGTSIIPGASDVEGSFTEILGDLAEEVHGFFLTIFAGASSGAIKSHLLDLYYDPAGGTSYTEKLIENLVCGHAVAMTAAPSGQEYYFPLRIPAGAAVAARVQGSNATAGTIRVAIKAFGRNYSAAMPVGTFSETVGTISGSQGVSVTPGNAADGSWTSLGTITRALWWWVIGWQVSNTALIADNTYFELAYGDATNKHAILKIMGACTTAEALGTPMNPSPGFLSGYAPVAAGVELFIRARCSGAPATGYNVVAVGVGG